jgi:hypothetical protein
VAGLTYLAGRRFAAAGIEITRFTRRQFTLSGVTLDSAARDGFAEVVGAAHQVDTEAERAAVIDAAADR